VEDTELIRSALDAMAQAYAPYSRFPVGAAIHTDSGVFVGVNVENSSYGLTICAERVAIGAAVAAGARRVHRVVVASTSSPPASPCGACRQVIAELGPDASVLSVNQAGERVEDTIEDLLPRGFRLRDLSAGEGGSA
jgi:cytidine deaminase